LPFVFARRAAASEALALVTVQKSATLLPSSILSVKRRGREIEKGRERERDGESRRQNEVESVITASSHRKNHKHT
jgi:hypothetical protein